MELRAEPLRRPASLALAIVWLAFTTGHAVFMLGGVRRDGPAVVAGLLAFYAAFLTVGFCLLHSALAWRRFARTFGMPVVQSAPEAGPGDVLRLVLRFPAAWPDECRLAGVIVWAARDEDGDLAGTFERETPDVSAQRIGAVTLVRVTGLLPLPSPDARVAHAYPELHLYAADEPARGWSIRLPDMPVFAVSV